MIRFFRPRAHVGGAHVEQMVGISGMIGEPTPYFRTLLDQRDPKRRAAKTQQMIGEQHAACAAADNYRITPDHVKRTSLSSQSLTVVHKRGGDVFAFPVIANDKNMPARRIAAAQLF